MTAMRPGPPRLTDGAYLLFHPDRKQRHCYPQPLSLSCHRPWAESAVAAAWRAGLSWRLGNYPPTAATLAPYGTGRPACRDLQTCAPSLSTVVRDADTRLPCTPRSRCPVRPVHEKRTSTGFGSNKGQLVRR